MNKQRGNALLGLIPITFIVVAAVGWILNIMNIAASTGDPVTGMFVLRCVGIFLAPLGAVLGYV